MGSGSRSKIKLTSRKSIMKSKGINSYCSYAVVGICIACLPLLVAGARRDQRLARREPIIEPDLQAAESHNNGNVQRAPQHMASQSAPVPTAAVPPSAIGPPPSPPLAAAASDSSFSTFPSPFGFPKSDLSSSPSYAPRYAMPPSDPWREHFPFEVANFRRRAQAEEEAPPEDDYKPSESKRKKHGSSIFKRFGSLIRNTGKAIVGAPSYIYKRYRGSWKKVGGGGGGGGKKKKGGWKSWSQSDKDKNDGYGGWEEVEPTGGYDHEPSQYPSDSGWKSGKGYSKGYDSHERRYDRDSNHRDYRDREYRERDRDYRDDYKDYKDYDNYRSPPPSSRPRDRQSKYSPNSYREETYDDYDGRRTTAYYGPSSRKTPPSSKRPYVNGGGSGSGKSGSPTRYDDEY